MFLFKGNIVKKYLFILFVFLAGTGCFAAKFSDLSNDDAGQLVFRRSDAAVFVFQQTVEGKYWKVSVFRGSGEGKLHPAECEVLEFSDDAIEPADMVIHLIYWNLARPGSSKARALYRICQKVSSPLGDKVNSYYTERNDSMRRLALARNDYLSDIRTVDRYDDTASLMNSQAQGAGNSNSTAALVKTPASVAQDYIDKALMILENNAALAVIQSLADNDQNLMAAFILFCDFQRAFYNRIPRMSRKDVDAVLKELNKTGLELIEKYRQKRSVNRKRETDFKALCPRKHGPWEYAVPAGINEMLRRVQSAYIAFGRLNTCSAMSEFPEWGNAALEVMQMTNFVELERKFDSAIRMYQRRIKP